MGVLERRQRTNTWILEAGRMKTEDKTTCAESECFLLIYIYIYIYIYMRVFLWIKV